MVGGIFVSDLKNMSHETIAIMSGQLLVGNHDTITLFGRQLQEQLSGGCTDG